MRSQFKPIKAPERTPKSAPPIRRFNTAGSSHLDVLRIIRRLLRGQRWDDQGGYVDRHDGKWMFVSAGLGQVTPAELDKLFEFAGMTADEIEVVGDCADCANSDDGYERGFAAPCSSCLHPSHINHFVPREKLTKRSKSR